MRYDAVVVGSGPNGLAAAIELARSGWSVLVREAAEVAGGGMKCAELTLPNIVHDVCSAVHPLAVGSPFFRTLPLSDHGLEWIQPAAPLAHPFDDGTAATLERSVEETSESLGRDAKAYRRLIAPLALGCSDLMSDLLAPLHVPRSPLLFARFGVKAIRSAHSLARATFATERARALFAGMAAHSALPLTSSLTAGFGLTLAVAGHAIGWPIPRGGARRIAGALVEHLRTLGGEVVTGAPVCSLDDLPPARAILLDLTPRQVLEVAGDRLPPRYRERLARFRHAPGVFKLDWALSGPIPWTAPECSRAATVHLGGTLAELTAAEAAPHRGEHAERPFVLLVQPSLFDITRAPAGLHTAWAYSHVPNGSTVDLTSRIEAQVERFAPGFRDLVVARSALSSSELERRNPNLVGGDISGGATDLMQLYFRPVVSLTPYATPVPGLFICSSSTPPGGGVHGMCGFHAARAVLKRSSSRASREPRPG